MPAAGPQHKLRVPRAKSGVVQLLIGTRKGAFVLRSDRDRRAWRLVRKHYLGHVVHHLVADPREPKSMLLAARTGHLGPTVFCSHDGGLSWLEASSPPAFAQATPGRFQRVVNHVFWLTPGHASEPGVWYAGTSPQGLFRTRDAGRTWKPVAGFNNNEHLDQWTGGEQDGTPDGPKLHSILIDPRDKDHMYLAMSSGGVFESRSGGRRWNPLNLGSQADFLPQPDPEYGQDPHHVCLSPTNPDRLWQQNHCGIYRMDRDEGRWVRVGANMPEQVGDIGFPIVLHPRDPDTVWVFPMDGTDVWPRTSPEGKPAAYRTRDAGSTWERQDRGFPRENAWWTVKRQCMAHDAHDPLGLYLGTTGGEIWGSSNEGRSWKCLARHLPHVYSLEVLGIAP